MQININTPRRLKNLAKKLSEIHKSLEDIPEIIIKLAPTNCANNKEQTSGHTLQLNKLKIP